jgi:transposase
MKITTIGIDLAKTTLSVHAIDTHGKTVMHKSLSRTKLIAWMSNLEPCLVGMEACGGAHDLARRLIAMGHDARLMAARFVQPYRMNQKNDANDAEAICEAVARPNMRFVPVKSSEQQALLSVHRVRAELIASRTALINQLRGLLTEFGVIKRPLRLGRSFQRKRLHPFTRCVDRDYLHRSNPIHDPRRTLSRTRLPLTSFDETTASTVARKTCSCTWPAI